MKIAIMGAGAVGSYYGALLKKAKQDVTFIARGKHLQAMLGRGLKVKSYFGNFNLLKIKATNNPLEVGKVDLIIFTVKLYDTIEAAKAIKPMMGEDTMVLPVQNPDMSKDIEKIVGKGKVFGGTTFVYVAVESPGVVNQTSSFQKIIFGELNGKITKRAKRIKEALERTGAEVILTDNIQKELWSKQVFIAPMFGIGSLVQMGAGDFRSVPETREILVQAMREVEKLAKASGVNLDKNVVKEKLEFIDNLNPKATTSMQRDVKDGGRSEGEEIFSMLIKIGKRRKVSTPVFSFIYGMLRPRELMVRKAEI